MPDSGPQANDELVESILRLRESRTFEAKRLGGKNDRKIETILAFANTDGGYLILGLEDPDKAQGRDRIYGVEENPEALDELKRLVRQRFTPPIAPPDTVEPTIFSVRCTLRDGRSGHLAVVEVAASGSVHSLVNGGTFVRLDRTNREISAAEITELSLRRGSVSFVAQPTSVAPELVNTAYFQDYATARRLTRTFPASLEQVGLAKRDADGVLHPTRAAVLLFAEDPAGVLDEKCTVRIFQYKGDRVEHGEVTNLVRPPKTIRGPLIAQIRDATDGVVDALAAGLRMGPLGFEVVQRYPLRVIREAITNAVVHRDYFTSGDIHVRIFDHRIEIESPGRFPGGVTSSNIRTAGSHPRNRQVVDHLRDFTTPPNLDAGEGVPMMVELMDKSTLYPPIYLGHSELDRDAVQVLLFNEARPSVWKQVERYLDEHGTIGNAEVRQLLQTDNTLRASKQLSSWVSSGLLVIDDPTCAKQLRRYRRPAAKQLSVLFRDLEKTTRGDAKR